MDSQCANMGRFVPAPGLFAPGQYTAVANQAHVVMSIACLASTLAFGVHAVAVSGAWVRARLQNIFRPYSRIVSRSSLDAVRRPSGYLQDCIRPMGRTPCRACHWLQRASTSF